MEHPENTCCKSF